MRGARFVFREHPGLFRYWLPPILLTGLALVGLAYGVLELRTGLMDSIWTAPVGEGLLEEAGRVAHSFVSWLVAATLFVVGVLSVALLTSVVAAPFNDALSQRVECIVRGQPPPASGLLAMLRDARRTIGLELLKLVLYLAVMGPLFIASQLVPVAGPIVYSVVGFYLTVSFLAIDYTDWPAARRGMSAGTRFGLAFRRPASMFGFGLGVWVLLFIPLINLFFMPAAVAGGTLLFLDLHPDPADAE